MEQAKAKYQEFVAALNHLAALNPDDAKVSIQSGEIARLASELVALSEKEIAPSAPTKNDFNVVCEQVERLHSAALVPAQNYRRIATITSKLKGLVSLASLPQNAELRNQIKDIVKKTAGIFSQVDTVDDLNKPLEQIENAVHKLYGDQNSPNTYNFESRGKGFHKNDK